MRCGLPVDDAHVHAIVTDLEPSGGDVEPYAPMPTVVGADRAASRSGIRFHMASLHFVTLYGEAIGGISSIRSGSVHCLPFGISWAHQSAAGLRRCFQ